MVNVAYIWDFFIVFNNLRRNQLALPLYLKYYYYRDAIVDLVPFSYLPLLSVLPMVGLMRLSVYLRPVIHL